MSDNRKREARRASYEDSYDAEVAALETYQAEACERLSEKWSEPLSGGFAKPCPVCKGMARVRKYGVERTIITRFGAVKYQRNYHVCACGQGFYPRDAELGFDEENLTRDVSGWVLDLVVNDTFDASRDRLRFHHNIHVSTTWLLHFFERMSAPLGDSPQPCPVVPLPLNAANAHAPVVIEADGSMIRQRHGFGEVKLWDIQVLGSTEHVYMAEARDIHRFEDHLRQSPGFDLMAQREVLWIADGAAWIWKMKERLCPHALELLDYYHAMEHAHDAAKALLGDGDPCAKLFADRIAHLLKQGGIDTLFDELKECIPYKPKSKQGRREADILWPLLEYYEKNRHRLNYRQFKERGWPLGSGSVESAHKRVIQKRMKQAGMRWSPENAQRMASMRALYCSVGPQRFAQTLEQTYNIAA